MSGDAYRDSATTVQPKRQFSRESYSAVAIDGPQLLYTTSSDAVINAPIVTIAAPIDGRIDKALAPEGTVVDAGAPLLTIENPIVDRSRLADLEAT